MIQKEWQKSSSPRPCKLLCLTIVRSFCHKCERPFFLASRRTHRSAGWNILAIRHWCLVACTLWKHQSVCFWRATTATSIRIGTINKFTTCHFLLSATSTGVHYFDKAHVETKRSGVKTRSLGAELHDIYAAKTESEMGMRDVPTLSHCCK